MAERYFKYELLFRFAIDWRHPSLTLFSPIPWIQAEDCNSSLAPSHYANPLLNPCKETYHFLLCFSATYCTVSKYSKTFFSSSKLSRLPRKSAKKGSLLTLRFFILTIRLFRFAHFAPYMTASRRARTTIFLVFPDDFIVLINQIIGLVVFNSPDCVIRHRLNLILFL